MKSEKVEVGETAVDPVLWEFTVNGKYAVDREIVRLTIDGVGRYRGYEFATDGAILARREAPGPDELYGFQSVEYFDWLFGRINGAMAVAEWVSVDVGAPECAPVLRECSGCGGSGHERPCPDCDSGLIDTSEEDEDGEPVFATCGRCKGEEVVPGSEADPLCKMCNGRGKLIGEDGWHWGEWKLAKRYLGMLAVVFAGKEVEFADILPVAYAGYVQPLFWRCGAYSGALMPMRDEGAIRPKPGSEVGHG